MNTKHILFGAAVLAVGAMALLPQVAFAYKGNPNVQGPNYTIERHNSMTAAFANRDYSAWKALMGERGITQKITPDNFAKFAEAHDLALANKTDEANAIRAELGLGQNGGNCAGQGKMNR